MNIVNLLKFAVENSASDIHLSSDLPPIFRVHGRLLRIDSPLIRSDDLQGSLKALLTSNLFEQFERSHELDCAIEIDNVARFRLNVFKQNRGIAAVFRVIPTHIPTLQDLQAPSAIQTLCKLKQGLILVTGPTGSGKSTTLAAIIDFINQNQAHHILTIEDPIEFVHASKQSIINQREVHRDTLSFANALKSALREDPDIILVGELRDAETIRLALTAAETGHLVFATLHTSSAAKSINRIIDVFPGDEKPMVRSMLSESLQAVIAQQLVQTIDGSRVAAHEILLATPAVRNLIREDQIPQIYSTIQTSTQLGMQTLDQALKQFVQKNQITLEQAQIHAVNKSEFAT